MACLQTVMAENALTVHPSDDETYGVDFSNRLPSGVTVSSATLTQTLADGTTTTDLTLGAASPNAATFVNHRGQTVAIGEGVQFSMTGGTAGNDYHVTVEATCSDGADRVVVCKVQVRDGSV
jgi:hypothetical protein